MNVCALPYTHKYFQPAIKLMIERNFKSIYFAMDKVLNIAIKLIRIFKNL